MFKFLIQVKNLDGIGVTGGTPYNLILMAANSSSNQIDCGEFSSRANAKTRAAAVVKATLSWTDGAGGGAESAVFTT